MYSVYNADIVRGLYLFAVYSSPRGTKRKLSTRERRKMRETKMHLFAHKFDINNFVINGQRTRWRHVYLHMYLHIYENTNMYSDKMSSSACEHYDRPFSSISGTGSGQIRVGEQPWYSFVKCFRRVWLLKFRVRRSRVYVPQVVVSNNAT